MSSMWNRVLATVSCTFCRPLSGSRRAPAETETLQRRPWTATLPERNTGFRAQSVFSREFTRSRSLTLPNYLMMMWLTWCGCHDGETTIAIDTRPWLGSFLNILPLITTIYTFNFIHIIYTYMHTCIHTYIHTYILTYLHTYILTYLHTYIHTYLHTYILTYINFISTDHKRSQLMVSCDSYPSCTSFSLEELHRSWSCTLWSPQIV